MLIDLLQRELRRSSALDAFWIPLNEGSDATLGVAASACPLLVAARFAYHPQSTLVVMAGEDAADTFARQLRYFLGDGVVLRYRKRVDAPFSAKARSPRTVAERIEATCALAEGRMRIVVASADALLRKIPLRAVLLAQTLAFRAGEDLAERESGPHSFEDVPRFLERAGYVNTDTLEGPGTYGVHGGAIDIFPGNSAFPVRIDFFGDEIDEIRRIIPATGQSVSSLDVVEIYPVCELPLDSEFVAPAMARLEALSRTNSALRGLFEDLSADLNPAKTDLLAPYALGQLTGLGAYVGPKCLTTIIEPRSIFDDATHAYEDICGRMKGSGLTVQDYFFEPSELDFGKGVRATYVSIMRAGSSTDADLPVKRSGVAGLPDKLFGRARNLLDAGYMVVFSVPDFRARQEMKLEFVEHGMSIKEILDVAPSADARLERGVVNIVDTEVPLGMVIPKARLAVISISDTQGSSSIVRAKDIDVTELTFPYKPGDYVVHAAHGIALFKELVRREIDGFERDYLYLEYDAGDKLFVPVEQFDRVTRYVGPEGSKPRLTRLNSSDWSRALAKAGRATKKLAFDLVDVYARRASAQGFAFSPDTPWQIQMEEAFPYQETADQLRAIEEVKADMCSSKPMDRLICGDVGFGKTEVALRAAFKATQDAKQVMVLCPTTILAQQHYLLFSERCEPFGVHVEVLSRFRTDAEQAQVLAGFREGMVDILVGTHRLLSRDVNPKDLGLVIIDEEQRFGVGHKEQLKNLRESIDVLTLSATPIPRTLQMSISGVRDMSLILTPPDDRRPVEVYVGEWDPDIAAMAIRRELARKGQVYYVSNRVRSIDEAVARVQAAAGEARVGVAHGQMDKNALERVMEDFSAGKLDVLVATTIIESGIDNPHTNTLIIEDSQRLGLSQMYQLKGRVGRSAVQAYAYFLFPENALLTEEAQARLIALNEHTELGSGLRIAMRDLEIRGAGNILGAEQSGNISAVGFDLFAQMLATAVEAAREGAWAPIDLLPRACSDTTVNVPGSAYLPDAYVPDVDERVLWYRKLASAASQTAVEKIYDDMVEKHPDMPPEAENMFMKSRIKAFCFEHRIDSVSIVSGTLVVEPVDIGREKMAELRRMKARYLTDKKKLRVPMKRLASDTEKRTDSQTLRVVYDFLVGLLGASAEA